jgi:hypothetical protein
LIYCYLNFIYLVNMEGAKPRGVAAKHTGLWIR